MGKKAVPALQTMYMYVSFPFPDLQIHGADS